MSIPAPLFLPLFSFFVNSSFISLHHHHHHLSLLSLPFNHYYKFSIAHTTYSLLFLNLTIFISFCILITPFTSHFTPRELPSEHLLIAYFPLFGSLSLSPFNFGFSIISLSCQFRFNFNHHNCCFFCWLHKHFLLHINSYIETHCFSYSTKKRFHSTFCWLSSSVYCVSVYTSSCCCLFPSTADHFVFTRVYCASFLPFLCLVYHLTLSIFFIHLTLRLFPFNSQR